MSSLINSLIGLVTPDTISKLSKSLGEDEGKVKTAVSTTVASLFGALLQKGGGSGLESLLKTAAGSSNILSNVSNLFSDSQDDETKKIGSGFVSSLLGDKVDSFTKVISSHSGISPESSGKLLGMLSPLVPAFLGNKMKTSGLSLNSLLTQLISEKSSFLSLMPSGLGSLLGVSSLSSIGSSLMGDVKSHVGKTANPLMGWLKWILPLLLLAALAYWLLGWGKSKDVVKPVTEQVQTIGNKTAETVNNAAGAIVSGTEDLVAQAREWINLALPGGVTLKAYKGGIEDQMLTFMQSDDYKNATEEQLKEKWFDFDNINFEFGSGTQLTKESEVQLENIVSIMKHYSDSKIKLGAYTDKKGDESVNLKISNERANTIKEKLIALGVPATQISGSEGYGSQFATVDAGASDEERAKDRRVSLRFEK